MIDLKREGPVLVLQMRAGENRFNPKFIAALNAALDQAEARDRADRARADRRRQVLLERPRSDLDVGPGQGPGGRGRRRACSASSRACSRRRSSCVAALNGHAFAGGAMLALACDFRVMRTDRGFFCIPEIDLGLPLAPGMASLIQARLPKLAAHEAIVTGKRYGGAEALERGIVDYAVPEVDLHVEVDRARRAARRRRTGASCRRTSGCSTRRRCACSRADCAQASSGRSTS